MQCRRRYTAAGVTLLQMKFILITVKVMDMLLLEVQYIWMVHQKERSTRPPFTTMVQNMEDLISIMERSGARCMLELARNSIAQVVFLWLTSLNGHQ